MKVAVAIDHKLPTSYRAKALGGMFDVPEREVEHLRWELDAPLEDRDWQVGLIVGPSGAGKSVLLREMFGEPEPMAWSADTVLDDFDAALTIEDVTTACSAVGFNTVPAWLRPYGALSNGERFRVSLARSLIEGGELVVMDEYSSVVDRQVAMIGSAAVAKYVRRRPGKRFVAATCHYDVEDWLQPDWVIEPHRSTFKWRRLRSRPPIACDITATPYSSWRVFAPFHYLTAELNKAARCYVLHVDGAPAAFAGMLHRPHPKTTGLWGCSRLVTLPDWQGLGLAFVLIDNVAAAYKAVGRRARTYPAHPALIHAFDRSPQWRMVQKPLWAGSRGHQHGPRSTMGDSWRGRSRPNAVFEWAGPAMDRDDAVALLAPHLT